MIKLSHITVLFFPLHRYRIHNQFCLAANIPLTRDEEGLRSILQNNPYKDTVLNTVKAGDVYKSDNIVIAVHADSNPVHAEYQVLKSNLQRLKQNCQGNFLLIYSFLSPCTKCTLGKFNIVNMIHKNVLTWEDAAFVFTRVYDTPKVGPDNQRGTVSREDLERSLTALGKSMDDDDWSIGLKYVYRCYQPRNLDFQCSSCSSKGGIAEVCLDNNAVPGQSGGRSRSSGERSRTSGGKKRISGGKNRTRVGKKSGERSRSISRSRHPG